MPRALSPIPIVNTVQTESPRSFTSDIPPVSGDIISDTLVAIAGDDEDDTAGLPGDRMVITPKQKQTGPREQEANEVVKISTESSGRPATPSFGRIGKRKGSVPPSRNEESAPIPLGGRLTRSASLRHKENKKNPEVPQKDKRKEVAKPGVPTKAATGSGEWQCLSISHIGIHTSWAVRLKYCCSGSQRSSCHTKACSVGCIVRTIH